jgi:hypothetical protein
MTDERVRLMTKSKRSKLFSRMAVVLALTIGAAGSLSVAAHAAAVTVWASPECGCCKEWVMHMRAAGFTVTLNRSDDMAAIKIANGVPESVQSCHTAVVDGLVIEGHVPADLVARVLAEHPDAKGVAAPGMPAGSPGMGNGPHEPYDVVLFGTPSGTTVLARR